MSCLYHLKVALWPRSHPAGSDCGMDGRVQINVEEQREGWEGLRAA